MSWSRKKEVAAEEDEKKEELELVEELEEGEEEQQQQRQQQQEELEVVCLLLLISMLWHRQAILGSKGDKMSSSAECRIRNQGLRYQISSRLNARWQTDWAIEDQA